MQSLETLLCEIGIFFQFLFALCLSLLSRCFEHGCLVIFLPSEIFHLLQKFLVIDSIQGYHENISMREAFHLHPSIFRNKFLQRLPFGECRTKIPKPLVQQEEEAVSVHALPSNKIDNVHAFLVGVSSFLRQSSIILVSLVTTKAATKRPKLFPVKKFRHL